MISEALVFLKNHLNENLTDLADWTAGESREDKVVFLDGEKLDPITFKVGAVTALLINLEEERILRPADRYAARRADGASLKVQPEIRINLFVLFVARFKQYERGLAYLSRIIRHFQAHRVFDHQGAPALAPEIERLTLELVTLPFAEQNEVWNALRTTYHPSVLYKVGLIDYRDRDARELPEIGEVDVTTAQVGARQ